MTKEQNFVACCMTFTYLSRMKHVESDVNMFMVKFLLSYQPVQCISSFLAGSLNRYLGYTCV